MTKVYALFIVTPEVAAIFSGKTSNLMILLALFLLPLLFLFLYLINFANKTLAILPSEEFFNKGRWAYANPESINHHYKSNPEEVSIDYTLGGNVLYDGIGFNLSYDFPFLDLSGYDTLTLNLFTGRAKSFFVTIRTFEPGISDPKKSFEPGRHCEVVVPTHGPQGIYKIPLSSLKDPQWWITQNSAQKVNLEKHPLKYSLALQVFVSDYELVGQRDALIIKQVSFHVTPPQFPTLLFGVLQAAIIWCSSS